MNRDADSLCNDSSKAAKNQSKKDLKRKPNHNSYSDARSGRP